MDDASVMPQKSGSLATLGMTGMGEFALRSG